MRIKHALFAQILTELFHTGTKFEQIPAILVAHVNPTLALYMWANKVPGIWAIFWNPTKKTCQNFAQINDTSLNSFHISGRCQDGNASSRT